MSNYGNDYLIHYGVKNMKWGVRRYQNEDGSLTQLGKERYSVGSGGNSKFDKAYRKEMKKYNKLRDKADVDLQRSKAEKHEANAYKAINVAGKLSAAGLGVGLAGGGLANELQNRGNVKLDLAELYERQGQGGPALQRMYSSWLYKDGVKYLSDSRTAGNVTGIATASLIGAGIIAAGVAGQQKARALIERRRTTPVSHMKVTARAEKQYNKISNMVKDTPYMALFKDQIEAYKKEHPNSELSDKQIMNNLM